MNYLIVPLHLDALVLKHNKIVTEAQAAFNRLPYFNGKYDSNPDAVNISETILSTNFENQNLNLKAGIHLHWSLPDALTRGLSDETGIHFPHVPNRWLVVRHQDNTKKQWIVESDYIQPEGMANTYGGITYPIHLNDKDKPQYFTHQPYCYLGRQLLLRDWLNENQATHQYLNKLTAVGYGEPAFAAFYPNCFSVFGAFDETFEESHLSHISYEVLGWYSQPNNDPVNQFFQENASKEVADMVEAIKKELGWQVPQSAGGKPQKMICYAQIDFKPANDTNHTNNNINIAVGNTATEALSALIADKLAKQGKGEAKIIEEQLEALQLLKKVNNSETDLHSRFNQAFHQKEFTAVHAGVIWQAGPLRANEDNMADPDEQSLSSEISLPEGLADSLNRLNTAQQEYERAQAEIRSMKQLLYADWYKYMLCAYPPMNAINDYPDMDQVKHFIRERDMKALQAKEAATGQLSIDSATQAYIAEGTANNADSLAGAVVTALHELNTGIDHFNTATIEKVILSQKFNASDHISNPVTLVGTIPENDPSSGPQCIKFNGTSDCIEIKPPAGNTVKGISFWVFIEGQQTTTGAEQAAPKCLLNIAGKENSTIDEDSVGTLWNNLYINGVRQTLNEEWSWLDIPKNEWLYIHTETNQAFGDTMYLMSRDKQQGFIKGAIAGLRLFNDTLTRDEIFCDQNFITRQQLVINQVAAPRYWQAQEPVVVIEGDAVKCGNRHGADGRLHEDNLLNCPVVACNTAFASEQEINTTLQTVSTSYQTSEGEEKIGLNTWKKQPWHPFILEWETEVFPAVKASGAGAGTFSYSQNYIQNIAELPANQPAISFKTTGVNMSAVSSFYSGRTVLSPHVGIYMDDVFRKYIDEQGEAAQHNPLLEAAREAVKTLKDCHTLSQSLGGFNAALLMQEQVMQLPVADPIGFEENRNFSQQVGALVGKENKTAPLPLNDFLPVRAGKIHILQLRLTDTFGQTMDLDPKTFLVPAKLQIPDVFSSATGSGMLLTPRITQPARLNFRFLSAANATEEMNAHPASSPVCGWLLANHLDNSLMVYNQQGVMLGIIDRNLHWQAAPGKDQPVAVNDISNATLKAIVNKFTGPNPEISDISAFTALLDTALGTIEPAKTMDEKALGLLAGRPVAVVRAMLNIEIQGNPAVNTNWNVFRQDMIGETRTTNDFEHVRFPVRIGEQNHLNDGLIGYWKEENQVPGTTFYTNAAGENPFNIAQSVADAPRRIIMLIDPRAKIHATTGILPVKTIELPADQYMQALQNIQFAFLAAPVLTPENQAAIPLPQESGYSWSWLYRERQQWKRLGEAGILKKSALSDHFAAAGEDLWEVLIRKGWINPMSPNRARIVPKDQRKAAALGSTWEEKTEEIQHLLDRLHLVPVQPRAVFAGPSVARDGWLQLTPVKNGRH